MTSEQMSNETSQNEGSQYLLKLSEDGYWSIETFNPDKKLKQMQGAVGGLVDRIEMPIKDLDMWVNDEFLMNNSGLNVKASVYAGQQINGNVAFATVDENGDTWGLNTDLCKLVMANVEDEFKNFLKFNEALDKKEAKEKSTKEKSKGEKTDGDTINADTE